jgi:hypothetical protein
MKAVNAKEFDVVVSWSVDRLGRSLTDLLSILQGLQGLDSSTTAGRAMFEMLRYLLSLSGGLFARGSMPVSRSPGRKERNWAGGGTLCAQDFIPFCL